VQDVETQVPADVAHEPSAIATAVTLGGTVGSNATRREKMLRNAVTLYAIVIVILSSPVMPFLFQSYSELVTQVAIFISTYLFFFSGWFLNLPVGVKGWSEGRGWVSD
jgi:hypothetical protein